MGSLEKKSSLWVNCNSRLETCCVCDTLAMSGQAEWLSADSKHLMPISPLPTRLRTCQHDAKHIDAKQEGEEKEHDEGRQGKGCPEGTAHSQRRPDRREQCVRMCAVRPAWV